MMITTTTVVHQASSKLNILACEYIAMVVVLVMMTM